MLQEQTFVSQPLIVEFATWPGSDLAISVAFLSLRRNDSDYHND